MASDSCDSAADRQILAPYTALVLQTGVTSAGEPFFGEPVGRVAWKGNREDLGRYLLLTNATSPELALELDRFKSYEES